MLCREADQREKEDETGPRQQLRAQRVRRGPRISRPARGPTARGSGVIVAHSERRGFADEKAKQAG